VDYVLSKNTSSKNGLPDHFDKEINWVDIRWVDDCIASGCLLPSRVISPVKSKQSINHVEQRIESLKESNEKMDLAELKSNDLLIAELANRMDYHRLKKNKFKYMAYRKAIQSISDSKDIIMSGEQAQKLPHVGKSISDKV
jgi:hypothetical protein